MDCAGGFETPRIDARRRGIRTVPCIRKAVRSMERVGIGKSKKEIPVKSQERAKMAGSLQGKVVLVTGGGSGIGRATSLLIAKQGAKVMIADYVPAGAEKTVAMIKEAGGTASCLAADVSVAKQVEMMVAKTVETYGRIDGAYNNAGIEGKMGTDTATGSEENFDRTIAINLKG